MNHMNNEMQMKPAEAAELLGDVHATAQALVAEIEKVVIGKRHEIIMLVTALLAGGHVVPTVLRLCALFLCEELLVNGQLFVCLESRDHI